jgi:glycosyltransferase involved in cell wall biosynthesis
MKRDDMNAAAPGLVTPDQTPSYQTGELKPRATVSVIIPTLNEAGNLPYVLNTIPDWIDEVVIVDGRSTDDTERIARLLRPDVKVVHELTPGKGAALKAGLYAASGEYLVALDADGSMDGNRLGAFYDALAKGAEYVKGSRFAPGGGSADITRFRRFGDGGICFLMRILFGARYSDATYGYFAVRADRRDHLGIDSNGFEVETLINIRAHRSGLKIAEVPCFEANRIHGESNLSALKDGLRIARCIIREKVKGHRAATV